MSRNGEPHGLDAAGIALWRAITSWTIDDQAVEFRPDELALLTMACRTADQVARLEAEVTDEPLTVAGSRDQPTVNPLVVELRLQRGALASLLARIDVPDTASEWETLTPSQRGRRAARARWDK